MKIQQLRNAMKKTIVTSCIVLFSSGLHADIMTDFELLPEDSRLILGSQIENPADCSVGNLAVKDINGQFACRSFDTQEVEAPLTDTRVGNRNGYDVGGAGNSCFTSPMVQRISEEDMVRNFVIVKDMIRLNGYPLDRALRYGRNFAEHFINPGDTILGVIEMAMVGSSVNTLITGVRRIRHQRRRWGILPRNRRGIHASTITAHERQSFPRVTSDLRERLVAMANNDDRVLDFIQLCAGAGNSIVTIQYRGL